MRILYCGDVVGRAGRTAIETHIPMLREKLKLDFVVVCGENATHGFGISKKHYDGMRAVGVDVVTLGNHAWDQRETMLFINEDAHLIRPMNYPLGTPGRGYGIYNTEKGKKIMVVQVMGRLFMDPLDDPFQSVDKVLATQNLGRTVDAIIVDIHGEATSEKAAMAHHCDGRVSLVVGGHTHVPSADARIFEGGTAFQTDAGMCGDYNSVIGMKKEAATARFVKKIPGERLSPAEEEGTLCGVVIVTDDKTGRTTQVHPVRVGGMLAGHLPAL
jgi:metallophosphoesterase (TIGR00282 family)